MPINFLRVDPLTRDAVRLDSDAHPLGNGEVYSFLRYGQRLLMATYSAIANLFAYNPDLPFHPGTDTQASNPFILTVPPEIASPQWRPTALVASGNRLYTGSTPGYGLHGGYITEIDPESRSVLGTYQPFADQSVYSLTVLPDGKLVGGTSALGGTGAPNDPNAEAHVFVWDPATKQVTADAIPVPAADTINDVLALPNGKILGFAIDVQYTLFVWDPVTHTVIHRATVPFLPYIHNAIALGPGNKAYGLFLPHPNYNVGGIFSVDLSTYETSVTEYAPGVSGGFALANNSIFFTSNSSIVQYILP